MAGLFNLELGSNYRFLDAGAGIGSLSSALIEKCISEDIILENIELAAFEVDDSLHEYLSQSLSRYTNQIPLTYEIFGGDFIEAAVNMIQFRQRDFTHAILNPPYKKINSTSRYRHLLRLVGIETVNLYSAFVALALSLMVPGGQIVAIIPRSFCNGPYYRPFREFILEHAAIKHIHLFDSRSKTFKDDNVLQENIIMLLERGGPQGSVVISTSTDNTFTDLLTNVYPFDQIVMPDDLEHFIHVPSSPKINLIDISPAICYSLAEIGINISTGPVVDFRLKEYLQDAPGLGSVPLLYPSHFGNNGTEWPKIGKKKPNAIRYNSDTEKWLYPSGFYCVVRRFSSKEEKRRIVASVVDPISFPGAPMLGFENHLNVFHIGRQGLPEALARGLAAFLNTTAVDEHFRRFSGHTQVNATDLKLLKYPNREMLISLGGMISGHSTDQQTIDGLFKGLIDDN
ncbi:MAG: Eco57I restriction-modification methylase domain-containing protein [Chloroflexi bacterium]|nr:Eco57I restriction-modification methylase domain-containing protein [Chloroflexota bacterium]